MKTAWEKKIGWQCGIHLYKEAFPGKKIQIDLRTEWQINWLFYVKAKLEYNFYCG